MNAYTGLKYDIICTVPILNKTHIPTREGIQLVFHLPHARAHGRGGLVLLVAGARCGCFWLIDWSGGVYVMFRSD